MTTSWTNVNKPTGLSWNNVPKPVGTSSVVTNTFLGGTPLGMLLAITTSSIVGTTIVTTSNWTSVAGHTAAWTNVPKAT